MPIEIPPFDPSTPNLARVDQLAAKVQALFGPAALYRLSKARPKVGAAALSTGSLGLDRATRIGGLPRGRPSVYLGGPSSGKTTLAYHLLAEAQRDGGLGALIDGEGSADPIAMAACGVDVDDLILASPRDGAEAFEMLEVLVRCAALDCIVATDVPAPAKLLSERLRRLNLHLPISPTALLFTRTVDARAPSDALAFAASVMVAFRQRRPLFGPGGDLVGMRVEAFVTKHKLAAPGGVAELEIGRGKGIDRAAELVALGKELGVLERHRSGLVYGRIPIGRSTILARRELAWDPDLAEQLAAEIRARIA